MKHAIICLSLLLLSCQSINRQEGLTSHSKPSEFSFLQENQIIADFRVEAVYESGNQEALGARFRHLPSGFVLDFLRIQSVPQAFMWVNSHPVSDQGEPHTLEHLLLGKGNKGRYVASLETMSLGSSSAFTMQLRTCYHFNTTAGSEVFFNLFKEKLDAMINPNFTDEEIRREVANMGISTNQETQELFLEEKGTVYNEMVSTFENPYANLYLYLNKAIYGDSHPISFSAGGTPAAIRTMVPADIRNFHASTHHLNNMGSIVAIPDELELLTCLTNFSKILASVQPGAEPTTHPDEVNSTIKLPEIVEGGKLLHTSFPHQNADEPGLLLYSFPPTRTLDAESSLLLDLFLQNLGSGQTSNLYKKFIDTQTRTLETGATGVYAYRSDDPGSPVFIGLQNIDGSTATDMMMDSIRNVFIDEIREIANYDDGSPELTEFNKRIQGRILETRKFLDDMLNSPPRFGYRGTGTNWMSHLTDLHREGGFKRSLVMKTRLGRAEFIAGADKNHWRDLINEWNLLSDLPFGISSLPDPEYQSRALAERSLRIQEYTEMLKDKYDVKTDAEALMLYDQEYQLTTEKMEDMAGKVKMPEFIDNPPLSLDETLQYSVESLPGGGELVYAKFNNLVGATVGLAFNMYAVPESDLLYVPALPILLSEIGAEFEGEMLSFDQMQERLRREILRLNVSYDSNLKSERVELVVETAGSNITETQQALKWAEAITTEPNISISNLSRISDVLDQAMVNRRNRMKGSEESWVNNPAQAYRKQNNPLYLSARSFLTQVHALHRLRWQLKGAEPLELTAFRKWMEAASLLGTAGRSSIEEWLAAGAGAPDAVRPELTQMAIKDMGSVLSDIPDETLQTDWHLFCDQLIQDLTLAPEIVIDRLNRLLKTITHQDNLRGYITANDEDFNTLLPLIHVLVQQYSGESTSLQLYDSLPYITERLKSRYPHMKHKTYVGLVNNNSSSGVHINHAPLTALDDIEEELLLNFLAAKLYGGGGAHSMFMKTWGAGLAYSNGLGSNEQAGSVSYYAERCPDLAQTMQFVIDQLEGAEYDPSLETYAVAQTFSRSRSGGRYEDRGRGMAADLADGVTPEKVASFRQRILELSQQDSLYDHIQARMEIAYGRVLPGYGPKGFDIDGASYFHIGPDRLLDAYEKYLTRVEGDVQLIRLHPRDFWLERTSHASVMP